MSLIRIACAALPIALFSTSMSAAPLLHYNFDEGTGTTAADSGTGTPAPGTLVGAGWTTNTPAGASASALDANVSTSAHVDAGDVDKLDGLPQLTLTAWVNLQGAPAHGNRIMAKQNTLSSNFDGFSFAFNNPTEGAAERRADNFQLNLALGGSGFAFNTSGADLDADNKWIFVAVTYDGASSSSNLKFWSGSETGSVTQLGPTATAAVGTLVAHSMPFRVAASSGGTASAPVLIDDVRVYDTVLSEQDLEAVRLVNVPEPAAVGLLALCLPAVLRRHQR